MRISKHKCIGCGFWYYEKYMSVVHKDIGICNSCRKMLETTDDKTYPGKGNVDLVISAYFYKEPISDALLEYKFNGQRLYGELFGILLANEISGHEALSDCDIIIPVPLHRKREKERGYNQSEIIARVLSVSLELPMLTDALIRTRNTEKQSTKTGLERVENVKNAFSADVEKVNGLHILLVDDIYTMGETSNACATALKNAGARKVTCVTLCKTEVSATGESGFLSAFKNIQKRKH